MWLRTWGPPVRRLRARRWRDEGGEAIASGEIFDCPNCAGLTLRALETDGVWTVREVKKASCAIGDEPVMLPDDVRPGDIVECHGAKHRVTYEFGAYALVVVTR